MQKVTPTPPTQPIKINFATEDAGEELHESLKIHLSEFGWPKVLVDRIFCFESRSQNNRNRKFFGYQPPTSNEREFICWLEGESATFPSYDRWINNRSVQKERNEKALLEHSGGISGIMERVQRLENEVSLLRGLIGK